MIKCKIRDLVIRNPKRDASNNIGRSSWYPYYAGFSSIFANALITSSKLHKKAYIADPWNGGGTTTTTATALGYRSNGYDLNPVMVIAARACLLNKREIPSIKPIAEEIILKTLQSRSVNFIDTDPLCTWLLPNSAIYIRRIERSIQTLLIDNKNYRSLVCNTNVENLSDIASFFYVALFRTVRRILKSFYASNPTWIKKPKDISKHLDIDMNTIIYVFRGEIFSMIDSSHTDLDTKNYFEDSYIGIASSDTLPVEKEKIDFILSSPPYCTRIDYAIATMPELAVLGYNLNENFQDLRRRLIGTSTVPNTISNVLPNWGVTCNQFLDQILSHTSKASKTYYYKNHIQYFDSIYRSISELYRMLKPGGTCILVVQDSFYKDIHNDLPKIFTEMAISNHLNLQRREDFVMLRTMAGINPNIKQYRQKIRATESVLCFNK